MNNQRQQAFLKLKPACVNLSSVALRFRTKDAAAKDVLRALEAVKAVLDELAKSDQLDAKLAEYAFFPLAQQVFNEAKRLSPRCLEVAAECVSLLVSHGYRQALVPELGKQLIILMSMLAGAGPSTQTEPATEELKIACFQCIYAVIEALNTSPSGSNVFEDKGTRNVVDQLVYLLLEVITESSSEQVQTSASSVLLQLIDGISSRVFLASLLPRTASALTKALKLSTKARRSQKVLTANLKALRKILCATLADRVALNISADDEREALGESWLRATSGQVKNALIHVSKLRTYDSAIVHRTLEELCVMVIEECHTTLADSVPVMIETLVILSAQPENQSARSTCRHLVIAYPEIEETLKASFMTWSRSLPRLMQAQDERPKQFTLQKLATALPLLWQSQPSNSTVINDLVPLLVSGIGHMIQDTSSNTYELHGDSHSTLAGLVRAQPAEDRRFESFILSHESQRETNRYLQELVNILRQSPEQLKIARWLTDSVAETEGVARLASFWLALQLLQDGSGTSKHMSIDDFLTSTSSQSEPTSRSSILSDTHAVALPLLSSVFDESAHEEHAWQVQALAMEAVVLYAETYSGESYRPELIDTLYPVLSFLCSPNTMLRSHAMTALDKLAHSCQYDSTANLLISNVDYLVNSVAWKLNTYNLSPEAPQILRMMIHLCGAELMPYLDDLIQSIFAALDNYHGYPEWVETLFSTLKAMVDVAVEQPNLAIASGREVPVHHKAVSPVSNTNDILEDLRARKRRKLDFGRSADEPPSKAPQRPWTDTLDGPSFPKPAEASEEELDNMSDNEANEKLAPLKPSTEEEEQKLSKTHALLLNIAKSTVPHLASPAPTVRHLLLDLLKDISPLLSRDENSFLPLVNAIWPVIVPRLFANQTDDEETAYNIAAAADTIAVLCQNTGDFMASRIEEVIHQLVRLFRTIQGQVNIKPPSSSSEAFNGVTPSLSSPIPVGEPRFAANDAIELRVVKSSSEETSSASKPNWERQMTFLPDSTRTSQGQILDSLINLLVSILSNVRLTLDTGDEIMALLMPFMHRKAGLRKALEVYNEDAVWLYDLQTAQYISNGEAGKGVLRQVRIEALDMPKLRPALQGKGVRLLRIIA